MAISAATRLEPNLRHPVLAAPRPPSTNPSHKSEKRKCSMGPAENRMPPIAETAMTQRIARTLKWMYSRYGIFSMRLGGICFARVPIESIASARPRQHPSAASKNPSTANCRKRRIFEAPSAPRTAISRLPLSARTSSKLETFTNPMRQRSPAPLSSATSVGRTSPRITSVSGSSVAVRSRLYCGYSAAISRAIALTS